MCDYGDGLVESGTLTHLARMSALYDNHLVALFVSCQIRLADARCRRCMYLAFSQILLHSSTSRGFVTDDPTYLRARGTLLP